MAARAGGRAARVRPALDQVRLRARRAAARSTRRASGPRTGPPRTPATSLEAQPAAARHRLRRPLPAAQPAHGRDRARRPVRGARAAARARASCATTASRWARRSAGATRACARSRSATSPPSRPSTTCSSSSPGATSSRRPSAAGAGVHGARADLERAARGQVHARDDLPAARPPQPPPARVARRGAAEGRAAALPVRGARDHDGAGGAASSSSPRTRSPACCRPSRTSRTSRSGRPPRTRPTSPTEDLDRIAALYERNFDVEPVAQGA